MIVSVMMSCTDVHQVAMVTPVCNGEVLRLDFHVGNSPVSGEVYGLKS